MDSHRKRHFSLTWKHEKFLSMQETELVLRDFEIDELELEMLSR